MKKIRYLFEAFFAYSFIGLLYLLPFETSSWLCGWLARQFGPKTSAQKVARLNLQKVFPNYDSDQINKILEKMWDNLGRNIGELPHLSKLKGKTFDKYITFEDKVKSDIKSAFVISAHFANWELMTLINLEKKIGIIPVQRRMNNPYINQLLAKLRESAGTHELIEKSTAGVKQIIKLLQNGGAVGGLMDQRTNNGIKTSFFGFDSMTSNLPEKLYKKGICDILFMKCLRINDCHSKLMIYKKKLHNKSSITQQINDEIQAWIEEHPEQWFWVHDRWDFYKKSKLHAAKPK